MTRIVPENVKRERLQAHVIEAIQVAQTVRGTQFIQIIAPCSLEKQAG